MCSRATRARAASTSVLVTAWRRCGTSRRSGGDVDDRDLKRAMLAILLVGTWSCTQLAAAGWQTTPLLRVSMQDARAHVATKVDPLVPPEAMQAKADCLHAQRRHGVGDDALVVRDQRQALHPGLRHE